MPRDLIDDEAHGPLVGVGAQVNYGVFEPAVHFIERNT